MIEYDEYELLELFEAEPSVVVEEELVFMYSKKDNCGFEFIFVLSVYACKCSLILSYKGSTLCVFNIKLRGVKRVYVEDEGLIIKSSNSGEIVSILLKPMLSLQRFKWKDCSFSGDDRGRT